MGKLTDDEIKRLTNNPNVDRVVEGRVYLKYEYRIELYNLWKDSHSLKFIGNKLKSDGIYFNKKFAVFYGDIIRNFKKRGKPKNKNYTISIIPQEDIEYLLSTNLFEIKCKGITVTHDFYNICKGLIESHTIEEIFEMNNIDLSKVSYHRMYTLNNKLKGKVYKQTKRDIQHLKDKYKNNKYIEFTNKSIKLNDSFYSKVTNLTKHNIKYLLNIFDIELSDFDYQFKYRIQNNINTFVKSNKTYTYDLTTLSNLVSAYEKELKCINLSTKYNKHIFYKFAKETCNDKFSISSFCKLFDISRSHFYKYINIKDFTEKIINVDYSIELEILKLIINKYPYPLGVRMLKVLLPEEHKMSRKKITKILKMNNLLLSPNKNKRNQFIKENLKLNLLDRRFRLARPLSILSTDVTYLIYYNKRIYLSAIKDTVTGKILSYHLSIYNDINLIINTIKKLDKYKFHNDVIFHSDQGIVYFAYEVQDAIKKLGFKQSMSKRGSCWDNASIESFFSRYKNDFKYQNYTNIDVLDVMTNEYVLFYNNIRPQESRLNMAPSDYEFYLNHLSNEEFDEYLLKEKIKYDKMKENSTKKIKERIKYIGEING